MKFLKIITPPLLSLTFVLIFIILLVNLNLPRIGHDYGYFIPRMLDVYLHQKINGLEIQWYTPSFGGGIPAYPNPQDLQYSLPQLLMFAVNPFASLMISLAFYSALGFLSFYILLRDECGFTQNASVLGATFILANGFLVEHAIVGHVGFQVFPLLGCILLLTFSKHIGHIPAGILLGILGALIVNQAGFYVTFIFSLSLAMLLPLMFLLTPRLFNWRRLSYVYVSGIFFAVTLSTSKLSAVYSFMRFFPREIRDYYGKTYFQGLGGLLLQLAGGMLTIPYYWMTGQSLEELPVLFQRTTGAWNGIWETDVSISPILILLLFYGIIRGFINWLQNPRLINVSKARIAAFLMLVVGVWLAMDFSLAQGWLFELLNTAPIVRSLHVNVRYAAAFIFPMAFAGAYVFDRYMKHNGIMAQVQFVASCALTVSFLLLYLLPSDRVYRRSFHINLPLKIYSQIERGERFPVMSVANLKEINVFMEQASNLKKLYEPIFGYSLEYFHPEVQTGSVFYVENGYYNMTNPASYVFPEENNLQPFERFRVDQLPELEQFVNRKQPDLEISVSQKISNILNLVALMGLFLYIVIRAGLLMARIFSRFLPAVAKTDSSSPTKND